MKMPFFKNKKRIKTSNFLELPSRDQKKIIMKAARKSNEKQLKTYKKYAYLFEY